MESGSGKTVEPEKKGYSAETIYHIVSKYRDDIANQISLAIKNLLEERSSKIDFAEETNIHSLEEVVHKYMKTIASNLTDFSKKVAVVLDEEIKESCAEFEGNLESVSGFTKAINKIVKAEKLQPLQAKILKKVKKNGKKHHYEWFIKKTEELKNKGDEDGMKMLDENFDFNSNKGLVINVQNLIIEFEPYQTKIEDIENIDGLIEGQNFWTKNEKTLEKGLWINLDALTKIENSGKKVCTDELFLLAANAFPGGDMLDNNSSSTKVKDLFDLLGSNQLGFRAPSGNWTNFLRVLLSSSSSVSDEKLSNLTCNNKEGNLSKNHKDFGFGVWCLVSGKQ